MILEMENVVRLLPKSPAKEGLRGALEGRGPFLCGPPSQHLCDAGSQGQWHNVFAGLEHCN